MPLLPDRDTISTYSANGKVNYQQLPPEDLTVDWDNPSLAGAIGNVAMLGLVAPRAFIRFTLASTSGGLVLLNWKAMWMNVTTTAPVLARSSTGIFTITLPSVVSDEYNDSVGVTNNHTVNLLGGVGGLEGSTPGFVNVSASANVITVNTFSSSGAASDLASSNCFVVVF